MNLRGWTCPRCGLWLSPCGRLAANIARHRKGKVCKKRAAARRAEAAERDRQERERRDGAVNNRLDAE